MKLKKVVLALTLAVLGISASRVSAFAASSANTPKVEYSVKAPSSPSTDYYANMENISVSYKGVRYWIFDNRLNPWPGVVLIGAYDKNNDLLEKANYVGARYIENVTVETDEKTITLHGQGTCTISWDDLEKMAAPKIENNGAAPSCPSEDYYVNQKNISIKYKGVRYWIFDNSLNPWPGVMLIAAYDKNNKLLGKYNTVGARYLESVTVDYDKKTVTFNGQGTSTMTWDALESIVN